MLLLGESASDAYSAAAGGLALALGLVASVRILRWYLGSRMQWLFLTIPWLLGLLIVAQVLGPFGGPVSTTATWVSHGIAAAMLLALVFLSPTLISFKRTSLQGVWVLLALGVVVLALAALVDVSTGADPESYVHFLGVLGYGTLAASFLRLHHQLRLISSEQPSRDAPEAISDTERLASTAQFLVEGSLQPLVQVFGRRALSGLEKRFNADAAAGAFRIENGQVTDTSEGSLVERSQAYATALSQFFSAASSVAGSGFVSRQFKDLFRVMPWEEREIGEEHLFQRLGFLTGVRQDLSTTRTGHVALLRSAPLFRGLGDNDLTVISDRLRPETYPSGKDIIKQGEPGRTFYLIESGTVEVWVRKEDGDEFLAVELGRGDYFGERALLNDAPRAATCRCKTKVQVLSLEKEDFDELVARRFGVAQDVDEAMKRADVLAGMPLFSEVGPSQVKEIASKLVDETHTPGSPIIRQGDEGDKFYVIKSGTVEVRRRPEGTEEETTVGRLGRGEYFGEIALLMNVPRTASVIAETDTELLSLDRDSFEEVVRDFLQGSRGLEQASSRRMIQLRRTESVGFREQP